MTDKCQYIVALVTPRGPQRIYICTYGWLSKLAERLEQDAVDPNEPVNLSVALSIIRDMTDSQQRFIDKRY